MKPLRVVPQALHHVLGLPFLLMALVAIAVLGYRASTQTTLVIVSGPEGGYFHSTALEYQQRLQARGIPVDVRPQELSLESLKAVNDPAAGVHVGFMAQRAHASDFPHARSLGVIADEPLFVFLRAGLGPVDSLRDVKGMRVALGMPGNGTHQMAMEVLGAYGIDARQTTLLPMTLRDSAAALREGRVDVAFFLQPLHQPMIGELARRPGVTILDLPEAEALALQLGTDRTMGAWTLPVGVFDVRKRIPEQEVSMPTEAVTVIVREDLDPGLMHHLLEVMDEVHGRAGLDREAGVYPRDVETQIPLHPVAKNYYRDGLPFLYRHLPFGLANGLFHLLMVILPLTIVGPALSFLGVPTPLKLYQATKCHLWLLELRQMLRAFATRGELSSRQRRRLGKLRSLLASQATGLDRCREAASRLP